MKLNQLIIIGESVEKIAIITDTPVRDITKALIGITWSDEEAYEIEQYILNQPQ